MIAWLEGILKDKNPRRCVIVCAGVGYGVMVPATTYARLPAEGEPAGLHIHTNVREGAIELFGFGTREEQISFETLIKINGVGPRLAMNILSGISPADLARAVADADKARLGVIPGIGKKTAEKILFELRDKLPALPGGSGGAAVPAAPGGIVGDLISALINLGYKPLLAEKAARGALKEAGETAEFDDLFRRALQELT
jgi:Holliday junction DNA helicase RuvA